ncbi:L,D-transpeptidase family protein [Moritella marina ATCC 15381]|uniref:L,D-transpeptidase family protein n=2 Tax=Moritella marina TaxID=90736 RepID=A0A5J6WQG2_MORMI|nr:L,D-transpeptidase family protein [Moritella marina ATCC 15381]
MVIAFAYSQQALAWSADHISIVGVDEGEDIAQTINDRYAVVHHPNKQLDHLLPVINDRTSVPMSKQARQFSSRVSYLNWLESQYPWNEIKLSGLLRIGDRSPEIHEIHSRLTLLGDSETSIQLSGIYSSDIAIAVRHFQRRHGLEADGVIGPATLKWLNVNPQRRAKLLTINMDEKMDYMANLGPRYLLVNIPAYELLLSDNGEIALRSRVIVGKPKKPTPILSSEIKSMVINPSWRVPRSILEDDLLPKLKLNGDFINQRNFTVFNYENKQVERTADEWEVLAGGTFPYRLEQMPGTNNALGRYKFYFPNNFSVYLHDTTNPKLFNNTNRALSSGCIRIEKVDELADWVANSLVDNKSLWTRLKISRNTTKWFPLNDVLPVHLVYWTAWMDDSGLSQYRDDIYALQR